jgi:hypothetical protein
MRKKEASQLYLDNLHTMVRSLYSVVKDYRIMPAENQAYINGYMMAGLRLGVVSQDDLLQIVDQENEAVFGMSVEKRRRSFRAKRVSEDDPEYLDIPTIERRKIRLW